LGVHEQSSIGLGVTTPLVSRVAVSATRPRFATSSTIGWLIGAVAGKSTGRRGCVVPSPYGASRRE
jgi:hypothetical protein